MTPAGTSTNLTSRINGMKTHTTRRLECMVNVRVQYDGGFLPDIRLLTQGYYHRGSRLNAMKRFCLYSLGNNNNFKHNVV